MSCPEVELRFCFDLWEVVFLSGSHLSLPPSPSVWYLNLRGGKADPEGGPSSVTSHLPNVCLVLNKKCTEQCKKPAGQKTLECAYLKRVCISLDLNHY